METRNTKQKEIILEIMKKEENQIHPTMPEIIALVTAKDKNIGTATIYRNVNKLVNEGVVTKLMTEEGFRYDIKRNLHGHFVCTKCGKITDIYDENYQKMLNKIEREHNVKIENSNLLFEGICEECNGKI